MLEMVPYDRNTFYLRTFIVHTILIFPIFRSNNSPPQCVLFFLNSPPLFNKECQILNTQATVVKAVNLVISKVA